MINVNRSFTITKKSESQKCGWEYIHILKAQASRKIWQRNLLSKPSLSQVFTRTCIFQAVWTNTDRRAETARILGQLSHSVNTEINRTNKDKQHLAKNVSYNWTADFYPFTGNLKKQNSTQCTFLKNMNLYKKPQSTYTVSCYTFQILLCTSRDISCNCIQTRS